MELFKTAIRIGLLFGCMFFVIDKAYADEFYPTGDGRFCYFSTATSISYDNLPLSCNKEGCISYDQSSIKGQSGSYSTTHTIEDLVNFTPGDVRKYPDVASAVSVPPNTKINIGMFVDNGTGHDVEITQSYLYISRADRALGDWSRLGADAGHIGWRSYKFLNETVRRYGRYLLLGNQGIYPNVISGNYPLGKDIYSFETIQPLSVESAYSSERFDGADLVVEYSLRIENRSQYDLENIEIEDHLPGGETYLNIIDISSGEIVELVYESNLGSRYERTIIKSPARVYDPNYHREAAAIAGTNIYDDDPEIRTLLIDRTDDGSPNGWSARQPDFNASPNQDYHYIELLPYALYSNEIMYSPPSSNLIIEKFVSDSDENMVKETESIVGESLTYDIKISNTGGYALGFMVKDVFDNALLEVSKVEIIIENQVVDSFNPQYRDGLSFEGLWLEHGKEIHFRVYAKIVETTLNQYEIENEVGVYIDDLLIDSDTVLSFVEEVILSQVEPINTEEVLGETGIKNLYKIFGTSSLFLVGGGKLLASLLFRRI